MAQDEKSSSVTSEWLHRNSDLYQSAIRAPFILAIRDGSLDFSSYTRWLSRIRMVYSRLQPELPFPPSELQEQEQDYVYVKSFVRYIASVLAKAPSSASDEEVDALLGGLKALQDELRWFRVQASRWDLSLHETATHETTRRYCKFLSELSDPQVEYPAALATLWVIEAVYNESFATCLETDAKTAPGLREACERWGNAEFGGYCTLLKGLADKALQKAAPATKEKAEIFFKEVLRHEIKFWSMSFDKHQQ